MSVCWLVGFRACQPLLGYFMPVSLTIIVSNYIRYQNVSLQLFYTSKHFILNYNIDGLRASVLMWFTIILNIITNRHLHGILTGTTIPYQNSPGSKRR